MSNKFLILYLIGNRWRVHDAHWVDRYRGALRRQEHGAEMGSSVPIPNFGLVSSNIFHDWSIILMNLVNISSVFSKVTARNRFACLTLALSTWCMSAFCLLVFLAFEATMNLLMVFQQVPQSHRCRPLVIPLCKNVS